MAKQHEALRVPERWREQERSFVMQLDRILDEIYAMLGNVDKRLKEIEKSQSDQEEEEP